MHVAPLILARETQGSGADLPPGAAADEATPRVAVLLSTYDGARFLPEQLDSLLNQSFPRWTLLWRDDGSSDGTVDVMNEFGSSPAGHRCHAVAAAAGHLGIADSFLTLLRQVPADTIAAFADQDDVWLPGKLERGVAALAEVQPDRPALYCARQQLVDEHLSPLGLSPYRGCPALFPAALTQNVATGCTVMLNPAAVALVAASQPPAGILHDWWSYLVISAADGHLLTDPAPVVLYRQHPRNAVGAPHSPLRRGLMALRRGPDEFMQQFRRHVAGLVACREALSPASVRDLLVLDRALRGGVVSRVRALAQLRSLVRQTRLETALFRLWFLIG